MARARKASDKPAPRKRRIEQYDHRDKQRVNNPPVGLVSPDTDPLDPPEETLPIRPAPRSAACLGGQGRAHFIRGAHCHPARSRAHRPQDHHRSRARRNGAAGPGSLFDKPEQNPPLRDALDFYKHAHSWTNRLIAGDSLLVMNSLLEKEGWAAGADGLHRPALRHPLRLQFPALHPQRDVKDGNDEDLTQEPEMLKAFRDTWELGIHSYLTYLRDRLLLARELLHESGSCFVQISDENFITCAVDG